MSIGMSFGHRIRHTQRLRQSLRLSQAQRLQIQEHAFTLRLALIHELRDERYEPKAICPACSRELTPMEIIRGFNQDPNDFTTCCSACSRRFEPTLVCFGDGTYIELPFYCDCQTLAQLQGKETLQPERFAMEYPAIYRSAIVHHGGIRQAFAKVGIQYAFEEISDWKNKIRSFLGRLPAILLP
ncbi:MAG: hypothetical protein UV20_C0043G0006 [Candidatus Magasanikbacteria bacterium GW2011_GWA2_42_32]|uniref:Uncharacterized protein n=1 Tax=Candidatus Magasanikbacteria bacterium GW2011_GWA2_42_32 TaxID=1619039 RepID=A0A0G0ZZB0_9BACT|nr:MAG: hypothetical protein UV20_C0043G0006 [Candidatus Magasanikbacteria bacterium GW2011_GWA2_42_32]